MSTTCLVLLAALACRQDEDLLAEVADAKITRQQFGAFLKHRRIGTTDQKVLDRNLDDFLEREALAQAVTQANLLDAETIAAELNEFRKEMLISRYFEKFLDERVSDAAIQAYYDGHVGNYEERKVHVAHILIRTNKGMSVEERASKLTAARDAHSQLSAGRDFGEVARERSEDRVSGGRGGDLGWVKQGAVDPKFSERIFAMNAGEVSEPFESAFGYHVVKVLEPAQTVRRPLESVMGDIRHQLRSEARAAEAKRMREAVKIKKIRSFPVAAPPPPKDREPGTPKP